MTQQEVNEAGGLGAWAAKHPGAPVRVYMHGDGFTGHVDLSEASKRRKEKGYKYTLEYRPGHKVKRNKSGWVDNLVEYGQEAKAIEEMTAPTKQVVEQLWSAAEKKQTTDARNNYDALNNKWSRTGDDMPFVDSSVRYLANETDRMKNFDLDKMSEEAWRRSGAALTQKVYQRLKLANPKTDDSKLIEQAEAEAWRLTNKAVYDYAVEKICRRAFWNISSKRSWIRTVLSRFCVARRGAWRARQETGVHMKLLRKSMGKSIRLPVLPAP